MADTPEGKVKAKVKKLLERWPKIYVHWPVQAGYGAPTLDAIGCAHGKYFGIECKAPGKHPTDRQKYTMSSIEEAGGKVFVIGEHEVFDKNDDGKRVHNSAYPYSGMADLEAWLLKLLP